MDWLKQFNNDYANAVQAITPIVLAFVSWMYYKLYKESKLNDEAARQAFVDKCDALNKGK